MGWLWVDELIRSPEYAALKGHLESAFIWQPGEYTVQCPVTIAGQKKPTQCEFRFVFGESAYQALKGNLPSMENNFRGSLIAASTPDTKPFNTIDWKWVYPYALTASATPAAALRQQTG